MFGRSRNSRFSRGSWPPPAGIRAEEGVNSWWKLGRQSVWNQCDRPWTRSSTDSDGALGTSTETLSQAISGPARKQLSDDPEDRIQLRRRAEAVLLFTRGPLPLRKLAQLAGLADATEARTLLRQLNELYDRTGSALRVEEIAGGYQLLTRPALAPWLRRFASAPPSVRLSSPAMETLAIVAYRQPVLRANIEAIRGVACGEILRQLMQRDLVRICGRSEELGRPYLYGTTKHFLQTFGLKDVSALPTISGAGVEDDSEDTCANLTDQGQALPAASPIEANHSDVPLSAISPFDAVTQKESDVSTACVLDDLCDNLPTAMANSFEVADSSFVLPDRDPRAVDDDDDEFFDDDDDEDDDEDDVDVDVDDDEEEWDDEDEDEEEEEVVEDDAEDEEVEDEWEEVGDEEDDADVEGDEDEDEDDDDDEEDDDWDDDDEDWDDDDEEEDEEDEEWD